MISLSESSFSAHSGHSDIEVRNRTAASREAAAYDAELVHRFNAGDISAFVEIMERHRKRLFGVAFAMLKNRADAEEIAQDAFIRAYRALGKFRGDASLSSWLHCITLNLARNRYWYFHRRHRHATISLDSTAQEESSHSISEIVATEEAGPAREAVSGEFTELVAHCMEQLEPRPREILMLRNSLNRSYEEIAAELGISVGTVKSRIARARKGLRELLVKACPEFGRAAQPLAWFEPVRPVPGLAMLCA